MLPAEEASQHEDLSQRRLTRLQQHGWWQSKVSALASFLRATWGVPGGSRYGEPIDDGPGVDAQARRPKGTGRRTRGSGGRGDALQQDSRSDTVTAMWSVAAARAALLGDADVLLAR